MILQLEVKTAIPFVPPVFFKLKKYIDLFHEKEKKKVGNIYIYNQRRMGLIVQLNPRSFMINSYLI